VSANPSPRSPNDATQGRLLEKVVLADYDEARSKAVAARINDPRFVAEKVDAGKPTRSPPWPRSTASTSFATCARPTSTRRFCRPAQAQTHYLDNRHDAVHAAPDRPHAQVRQEARRRRVRSQPEFEKIGKYARCRFCVEPGMDDSTHATRPITSSTRSTRSASATAPIWRFRRHGHQLRLQRLDHDRGVATTPPSCSRTRRSIPSSRSPSLRKFFLPEGIGEVESATSSTKEVIQIAHNADRLKASKEGDLQYALGDEFMQAMEIFVRSTSTRPRRSRSATSWSLRATVIACGCTRP